MSPRRRAQVVEAPLAVTIDGALILNVAASHGPDAPKALLERALAEGRPVFIGIGITPAETAFAMRWADDSGAELAAWLWGARQRRRRARSRIKRRTTA